MKGNSTLLCFWTETHRSVTTFCISWQWKSFIVISMRADESPTALGTLSQLRLARVFVKHFAWVALCHCWWRRNQLPVAVGAYKRALESARWHCSHRLCWSVSPRFDLRSLCICTIYIWRRNSTISREKALMRSDHLWLLREVLWN